MTTRFSIILAAAFVFGLSSHHSSFAQSNNGSGNDFLSGIFGQQVPTYQGEPNGGQTSKKQDLDPNRDLRLGIMEGDESSGDSADSGESEGGGSGGGSGGGEGSGGGASET